MLTNFLKYFIKILSRGRVDISHKIAILKPMGNSFYFFIYQHMLVIAKIVYPTVPFFPKKDVTAKTAHGSIT